jgi:hypothetical protein
LRKRITLTAILGLVLAAILTGTAVIAQTPTPTPSAKSNITAYSNGANVAISLPQGNTTHPLDLRIAVSHIDPRSDYGGPDTLSLYIWAPAMNMYVPVAILSTNTDPDAITWIKGVMNNTPIWTPPTMMNYFTPTTNQFKVYMDGDNLWVNSTASYNITLPAQLGGNFTLPPMTLMFIPIGQGFAHQETTVLAKPQYSGWTIQMSHTDVPAWVRLVIPAWVGNSQVEVVGTMMLDSTTVYIPPSS